MARQAEAARRNGVKQNGNGVAPTAIETPQTFDFTLSAEEVILIYLMCAQGSFQESAAKRAAAGIQDKTEPIFKQLQGQQ